jgi:signal transduction histidine kinase
VTSRPRAKDPSALSAGPRRFQPSIRVRLALVYGGVFFVMGLGLMGVSYAIVDHSLSPPATTGAVARFIAFGGSVPCGTSGTAPPPPMCGSPSEAAGRVTDPNGSLVPAPVVRVRTGTVQGLLKDVRVETLRQLLWTWSALIGLMAVAAGVFGWLLSGRMLRPLRDITGTARRLSVENLHERIGLDGPRDELRELGDTFDGMLARLDGAFASQRRFAANASHELRTPLAIMRAQIDVALSDPEVSRPELLATSRVVRDAVDRCERLLDGLLVLAHSDRGLDAAETVDLAESASRALDLVSATAAERGIELRRTLRPAAVRGDRALIERMVANLVENAVAYNRNPGWVEVATSNGGALASVRVTNSGPHVAADQVPSLFEPFRRLSRERTGSGRGAGLGLSIVRSVARAHGGEVSARGPAEGGLAVVVELPATPA